MGTSPSKYKIYTVEKGIKSFVFDKKWNEVHYDNQGKPYKNHDFDTTYIRLHDIFIELGFETIIKNTTILKMVKESKNNNCIQVVIEYNIKKCPSTLNLTVFKDLKPIKNMRYNLLKYCKLNEYKVTSNKVINTYTFESGELKFGLCYLASSIDKLDTLKIKIDSNATVFYDIEFRREDFIKVLKLTTDKVEHIA